MFNIDGDFHGRDGVTKVQKTNLSYEEMRRCLTKDLYLGFIDEVAESPTIPNGYAFYSEETEAVVIALDDESYAKLGQLVQGIIDTGNLFNEGETPEDDTWADGEPMTDEDRDAAVIG